MKNENRVNRVKRENSLNSLNRFLMSLVFLTSIFFCGCSNLFYQPDSHLYIPPEKIGYQYENIIFESKDGTELHAWLFKSRKQTSKGLIVQFHGNAQNISSHYASLVWLTDEAYDLLIFDYRGYGRSAGEAFPEGLIWDGVAALEQAWQIKEKRPQQKLIVWGQSLGGLIAMRSLHEFSHKQEVAFLVLESTFPSYQKVASQKVRSFYLTWILFPLTYLLFSDQFSPDQTLSDLQMPKLIIHDERDPVISYENGLDLRKRLPEPKEFWSLNRGGHIATFSIDGKKNKQILLNKLSKISSGN